MQLTDINKSPATNGRFGDKIECKILFRECKMRLCHSKILFRQSKKIIDKSTLVFTQNILLQDKKILFL
jgi:hypothetical protein